MAERLEFGKQGFVAKHAMTSKNHLKKLIEIYTVTTVLYFFIHQALLPLKVWGQCILKHFYNCTIDMLMNA